ncbi:MAG: hypothetical protein E6H93_00780 [Chloroflexi bacterium]|nr:MAG: hypothetical protein E6H93_00780 [Chloroflexota bacterium]
MKRLLASLLTVIALTACASPLAKPETPQQALSGAAQRASQLKSAKFDLQGHVAMTFPPQMAQMFGQSGANGTLTVDLSGNGEAQFPDRYHMTVNAKMAGLSIATEVTVANGKAYVKNPLTQKWEASAQSGNLTDQLGQPDPLSYDQYLKNVKSIKDLGDTSLAGATVHHYQLTPDKDKLLASLAKRPSMTPQALAAVKQVLDSGTMTIDVWFGKDDHLVRRVSVNADYTVDLNQLMGSLGASAAPSGSRLPAGAAIHAIAAVTINYHHFDAPVTISIPSVS